jgi:membrane protein implicated in regulation of membrane protease activity
MAQSDISATIDWQGHPWMTPALIWLTVEALALAIILSWIELFGRVAFMHIGSVPLLDATLGFVILFWLIGALRLAITRATNKYTLRGSNLEIQHGIIGKRIFTISAAGFSDLEVLKSVTGRLLNMGTIIVETDSHRDLKLINIRDPIRVGDMIRQVMTVPTVRVAPPPPPSSSGQPPSPTYPSSNE